MNRVKKYGILFLIFLGIVLLTKTIFANDTSKLFEKVDYTEEFKMWLNLSDEEKERCLIPRMYKITPSEKFERNLWYRTSLLGTSLNPRYSLKDVIPNNLSIRNQGSTQACWAFASISSLETNLALSNLKSGENEKIYDFSERHMEYANSRIFANSIENPYGYNRTVGSGGYWYYAQSYLTNGLGAINETEMPFEYNENIIDISEIQNKTVTSQVYDTVEFADYRYENDEKKAEIMNQIKQHIKNYGSVFALMHGNSSSFLGECYNNETGAKYCNNTIFHQADHAVSIIGWDDNYSIDNFAEECRPTSKGAWIIRNSWGERIEYDLLELKESYFDIRRQECIANGWNSAEEVPNEIIEQYDYIIEDDMAYKKIGDNGIMYVSYEDVNISKQLYGIIKATDTVEYENLYQYDEFYPAGLIRFNLSKVFLCNIFDKKSTGPEYLTQVSITSPDTYKCKVYVNPNGDSKSKNDMQLIQLKAGETETINAGYHTIEFARPVEIRGNKFAVVIELEGTNQYSSVYVYTESKNEDTEIFDYVKVENGKCFVSVSNDLDSCEWFDLGKISQENEDLENGDSTIKAFTTNELIDESLKNIEIINPPTKVHYFENENFDASGMVVKANYNSKKNPYVILDSGSYSIENGTNLSVGQTSVKITFEGKETTQPITVEKNSVINLRIITPPTKTEYKEGQSFERAGMVIEADFKDGTTKTITDYTVENGNNLKTTQNHVTISYGGISIDQDITVIPNPLIRIDITNEPNKVKYVEGQDFDKTGMIVTGTYQDGSKQEIIDYVIENGTNLLAEQTSVRIKYEGMTADQSIIVEEKKVERIRINKLPAKTQYIQNKEDLELAGGSIIITYNDGTEEEVDLNSEDVTILGFNNKNVGKNIITVEYETKKATFEVQIIAEAKPENSDFSNINSRVNKVEYYMYSDPNKEEYMVMDLVVDGIIKSTKNDSLEYYYYISPNQIEDTIEHWVKITENQDDNTISFKINTKDISNYDDILKADDLYLYIREVAKLGGNQQVKVTNAIKLNSEASIEVYVDDEKIGDDEIEPQKEDSKKDDTVAKKELPNTGIKIAFISVGLLLIFISIKFIQYRRLKDL